MLRSLLIKTAWKYVGRPYIWGGDDPMAGFDCSGLVIECLKSVGWLPNVGDWTANDLFNSLEPTTAPIIEGDLVFFGQDRATHVGICINSAHMIHAGGGGSAVTNQDVAVRKNAYVMVRPINYRADILGYRKPWRLEHANRVKRFTPRGSV